MLFGNISAKRAEQVQSESPVYTALKNGLAKMRSEFVDRVILGLYGFEPPKNVTHGWLDLTKYTYYPFEVLHEDEQRMILDGKHYEVYSLVLDNVMGIVKYSGAGFERYTRRHVIPLLPNIRRESTLNYLTEGGATTEDDLRKLAQSLEEDGWATEAVQQRIEEGIKEYHAKTRELMEKAGVYKALERMEQRKHTPFEQVFVEKA